MEKHDINYADIVIDPNGDKGIVSEVSAKGRCIVFYDGGPETAAAWHASALTKITEEGR